ncbi:MAG: site-2 protease family protein [Candidatus Paceibacteria bacterium]
MESIQIASILILIVSVVIHEMAHAYAANWLGDPTARLQGRLSPNPLVHLDPLMSVILPGLLILSGSPLLFGAAKPVPYNPYNFTNQKWGETLVAAAGPVSNIVLAIIFAVIIRVNAGLDVLSETFIMLAGTAMVLNIFLALFNLLPIPPLDGSKILPRFLPFTLRLQYERFRAFFENNPFLGFGVVILLFVLFLGRPLLQLTYFLTALLAG